jgi:hypothetical protein
MPKQASSAADDWPALLARLPLDLNLDELARASGAIRRRRGDGVVHGETQMAQGVTDRLRLGPDSHLCDLGGARPTAPPIAVPSVPAGENSILRVSPLAGQAVRSVTQSFLRKMRLTAAILFNLQLYWPRYPSGRFKVRNLRLRIFEMDTQHEAARLYAPCTHRR